MISDGEARPLFPPVLPSLVLNALERHDVISDHPEKACEIHAQYVEWLEGCGTDETHLKGRRKLYR